MSKSNEYEFHSVFEFHNFDWNWDEKEEWDWGCLNDSDWDFELLNESDFEIDWNWED